MKLTTKIRLLNKLNLFNLVRSWQGKLKNNNVQIIDFYSQFVEKGDLCFDVGANIGEKVDLFLKLGAKVIAIEPQPECLSFLNKKYKNNSDVRIVDKALDVTEGEKVLHICEANAMSTMSSEWINQRKQVAGFDDLEWNKQIKISTTTLDSLINEFGNPKFCKIDVEGFELNVIKGLTQKIPYISCEITPESLDSIEKCMEHLVTIDEMTFNHCSYGCWSFNFDAWLNKEEAIDLIKAMPSERIVGDLYIKLKNM